MKNKIVFAFIILMSFASLYAQTSVSKQDALVLYHNGKYREAVQVCE